jgi:hypothetical protein
MANTSDHPVERLGIKKVVEILVDQLSEDEQIKLGLAEPKKETVKPQEEK